MLTDATAQKVDGSLGVVPAGNTALFAIIAPASSGPLNSPIAFGRKTGVQDTFGSGPLVEAAVHAMETYGVQVLCVRSGASVGGTAGQASPGQDGTVAGFGYTFTGTSVPSLHTGATPDRTAQVQIMFPIGGVVGVAGIVYQVSEDGGDSFGLATSLGTASAITVRGVQVDLTHVAGQTITAGDEIHFNVTGPTAGSAGTVSATFAGSSTASLLGTAKDAIDGKIVVLVGGRVGVDPITLSWSPDAGRTTKTAAIGTAHAFTFPGLGITVSFTYGAGQTLVAGDTLTFSATAPSFSAAELGTALDALFASTIPWEVLYPGGAIGAAEFDMLEAKFASAQNAGDWTHEWVANTRVPNPGETEPQYLAALVGVFGQRASINGCLYAGDAKITSTITGYRSRRPVAMATAAREASVQQHINIGKIDLGPLAGVQITDDNGNPENHDERINPGLDDARFAVLRTRKGRAGVFVNRPLLFHPVGSDYRIMPHARVMNLAIQTYLAYVEHRLSQGYMCDQVTGYLAPDEAREIENGANQAGKGVLGTEPMVSAQAVSVARDDDLLRTDPPTMHFEAQIQSLAYPEKAVLRARFVAFLPAAAG